MALVSTLKTAPYLTTHGDSHAGSVSSLRGHRAGTRSASPRLPEGSSAEAPRLCLKKVSEPNRLAERAVPFLLSAILGGRGQERGREWSTGQYSPASSVWHPGWPRGAHVRLGCGEMGPVGMEQGSGRGPSLQRLPCPIPLQQRRDLIEQKLGTG